MYNTLVWACYKNLIWNTLPMPPSPHTRHWRRHGAAWRHQLLPSVAILGSKNHVNEPTCDLNWLQTYIMIPIAMTQRGGTKIIFNTPYFNYYFSKRKKIIEPGQNGHYSTNRVIGGRGGVGSSTIHIGGQSNNFINFF